MLIAINIAFLCISQAKVCHGEDSVQFFGFVSHIVYMHLIYTYFEVIFASLSCHFLLLVLLSMMFYGCFIFIVIVHQFVFIFDLPTRNVICHAETSRVCVHLLMSDEILLWFIIHK